MSPELIQNYAAAHGCSHQEAEARLAHVRDTDRQTFETIVQRWGTDAARRPSRWHDDGEWRQLVRTESGADERHDY
jgi:hypothetical protein